MAQLEIRMEVKNAIKSLNTLDKSLGGVTKSTDRFAKSRAKLKQGDYQARINKETKAYKAQAVQLNKLGALKKSVMGIGGFIGAGALAYGSVELIKIADQYTNINSRLKLVTDSSEELARVQQDLFDISQETGTAYLKNASALSKLGLALESQNVSTQELLDISELLNKSLTVSGASQEESTSFMLQYTQALSSGVLAGEEYRAMTESNSYFATKLADALGVTRGELKKMSRDQELTTDVLRGAMQKMSGDVSRDFDGMAKTVSRAVVEVKNAFGDLINDTNEASGATGALSANISEFARTITENKDEIIAFFTEVLKLAGATAEAVLNIGTSLQGWKAVISGDINFLDFATMNPDELDRALAYLGTLDNINEKLAEARTKQAQNAPVGVSGAMMYDPEELRGQIRELEDKKAQIMAEERTKALEAFYYSEETEIFKPAIASTTAQPKDTTGDQAVKDFYDFRRSEDEAYARDQQSLFHQEVQAYKDKEDALDAAASSLLNQELDAAIELQKELEQVYIDVQTPLEEYTASVARLNFLLGEGLDAETHSRALQAVEEDYKNTLEEISTATDATFKEDLGNAVSGWASSFSSQLVDIAFDADASFGDILESFVQMLAQMVVQKQLVEPLLEGFTNWGSGLTWGGATKNADGGVYSSPSLSSHSGSVVSSPTMFAFADGAGIMGEAGAEAILPLKRGSDGKLGVSMEGGSSSDVVVNIYNEGNDDKEATASTKMDDMKRLVIDVVLSDKAQNGQLSRATGGAGI